MDGTILLGTGTLTNGTAILTTTYLASGSSVITATYSGDSSDFAGSATTDGVSVTVSQALPTLSVVDAGGTYNGSAFPATASVAGVISGVDTTAEPSLEGVSPTLTYYVGNTVSGDGSATAPNRRGTYTVVASFAGSTDYLPAQSNPLTFTVFQAAPTISVTDGGGTYNGSSFPATATVAGVNGIPASSLEGISPTFTYYAGRQHFRSAIGHSDSPFSANRRTPAYTP